MIGADVVRALSLATLAGLVLAGNIAMRAPFQEAREPDPASIRARIAEGFRFLWSRLFLRTCALLYGLGNFLMPGVLLVLVVVGRRQGPLGRRDRGARRRARGGRAGRLARVAVLPAPDLDPGDPPARAVDVVRVLVFVVWPNVYALLAVVVPFGVAAPVTDSVVDGYRVALTPDHLLGRVETARSTVALLIAPPGPLVAGVLLSAVSARATVAVFAAGGLVLTVWGTLSRPIRAAPSLRELDEAATLVT
jgi:hypothetical protein